MCPIYIDLTIYLATDPIKLCQAQQLMMCYIGKNMIYPVITLLTFLS